VSTALAVAGWLVGAGLAVALARARRRLALVAAADHELRNPVATLELVVTAMAREPGGRRHARSLRAELERLRVALSDLAAARDGRRAPPRAAPMALERMLRGAAGGWRALGARSGRRVLIDWRAGDATVFADRGRMAQLFSNLVANAVEHGSGPVEIRGRRDGATVRVEVRDQGPGVSSTPGPLAPGHGHGLPVAAAAAREAGGRLTVHGGEEDTNVAVELPLAE
jgi:signal transduction histidine kinase